MMNSGALLIRVLFLGACLTSTQAYGSVVLLSTADHPNGASSLLNITLNLAGLQNVAINNVGLSGTATANYSAWNLPANSGNLQISSPGGINLANVTQSFGNAFSLLAGSVSTVGVGAQLSLGPVAVANRNFSINNLTPGGLSLNSGTLQLNLTGGLLIGALGGPQVVNVDLAASPANIQFSGLTNTIAATADGNEAGLDTNGAEVNIPLTITSSFDVDLNGNPVTIGVTTTGNLFLGSSQVVPEPSSALMVLAASCFLIGRRRFTC